jgi:hypothetical protein
VQYLKLKCAPHRVGDRRVHQGGSVRDRLTREKQLPIADAVRLATKVAAALDYAHVDALYVSDYSGGA